MTSKSDSPSEYRPDIDGLRALAILPVLFYHAGIPGFSGGFVGVDIFFVISGFLITTILYKDHREGRFSIIGFYERRFRRILPALLTVMAAVVVVGYFVLLPYDYKELGQSAASVSLFWSNVFFFLKSGYFDSASETKPLLHTWSLGVEEQFYIFWPFVLMLFVRLGAGLRIALFVVLFALSFAVGQYLQAHDPSAAFYLIFSRTWELMLGALLALFPLPRPADPRTASLLGGAGLLLIVGSVVLLNKTIPFPGVYALLPCMGAVMVIHAGAVPEALSRRVLAWRPLVLIGLISYSLYLWHWPVLALARYGLMHDLGPGASGACLALSALLAALSYRFIETPFRKRSFMRRQTVFAAAGGSIMVVLAFGVAAHLSTGFPSRLPPDVVRLASATTDTNPRRKACDAPSAGVLTADTPCRIGDTQATKPSFAVIGDSFADAMMPGVDVAGQRVERQGVVLMHDGCPFLPGIAQFDPKCIASSGLYVGYLRAHPEIATVFIANRWPAVVSGQRFGTFGWAGAWLTDPQSRERSIAENQRVVARMLLRLSRAFPDRRFVYVVGVPEQQVDVPRFLGEARLMHRSEIPPFDTGIYRSRADLVRQTLAQGRAAGARFEVLDLSPYLCPSQPCPVQTAGRVFYADDNHLTSSEATALSDVFVAQLSPNK